MAVLAEFAVRAVVAVLALPVKSPVKFEALIELKLELTSKGIVTLFDPSKGIPLIVRGVSNTVAFAATFAKFA